MSYLYCVFCSKADRNHSRKLPGWKIDKADDQRYAKPPDWSRIAIKDEFKFNWDLSGDWTCCSASSVRLSLESSPLGLKLEVKVEERTALEL